MRLHRPRLIATPQILTASSLMLLGLIALFTACHESTPTAQIRYEDGGMVTTVHARAAR